MYLRNLRSVQIPLLENHNIVHAVQQAFPNVERLTITDYQPDSVIQAINAIDGLLCIHFDQMFSDVSGYKISTIVGCSLSTKDSPCYATEIVAKALYGAFPNLCKCEVASLSELKITTPITLEKLTIAWIGPFGGRFVINDKSTDFLEEL